MNKRLNRKKLCIFKRRMNILALLILIFAALHAGLVGIFGLNVLLWLFDGQTVVASRIINVVVAAAGLWCINLIVDQSRKRPAVADGGEEEAVPTAAD